MTDATTDPDADLLDLRDRLLEEVMANVAFDGWTDRSLRDAVRMTGADAALATAAFPDGIEDALIHLHDWADRRMLAAVAEEGAAFEALGTTDRVAFAVFARFEALSAYKEAVRRSIPVSASPRLGPRQLRAGGRTVDRIWRACGDTATDFSHYTKRALLLGVIGATTLHWLSDHSADQAATHQFLRARLAGVVRAGKTAGRLGSLGAVAEAPWRAAAMLRRQFVREG